MAWTSRATEKAPGKPRLPVGRRIYAIGDLHGRADLLKLQLQQIDADGLRNPCGRSTVVFLGDYLDRGPASQEVIELLLGCNQARETVALKGNHESFLLRFLDDPSTLDEWRSCGGLETLISYGLKPSICPGRYEQEQLAVELAHSIPQRHLAFLNALELSYSCGDFLFVHAGIRPDVPLRKQREEDLLWIRDEFLSWDRPLEKYVVHGHTPVRTVDIRANRANIDTGAFATGCLTCVAIEGSQITPLSDVRSWTSDAETRSLSNKTPDISCKASQTHPADRSEAI